MPQIDIQRALRTAGGHHNAGRLPQAEAIYRQILAENPRHAEALHRLGLLAGQSGNFPAAIDLIGRSITLDSAVARYHSNLGNMLFQSGKPDEAIAAYHKSIQLDPNYAAAHNNLGNPLRDRGRLDEAIVTFRRAIALQPDFAMAHFNLATTLLDKGQSDEAIREFKQAIFLQPDYAEAHFNLGNHLRDRSRLRESIASFRQAALYRPDVPEHHWNLAVALLLVGDYQAAWPEFEWRLKSPSLSPPRQFDKPQWDGQDLCGRTILLYAEQGFGDTIQFVRYAPLVTDRGGRVILACQDKLSHLMQSLAGIDQLLSPGAPLPPFDAHCPLLTLPGLFATDAQTIPAATPYLHPDPQLVRRWAVKLGPPDNHLRVGLVWSGSPAHKNDRYRSIALSQFAPLADLPGIQFHSLQTAPPAIGTPALFPRLHDWSSDLTNFAETAALLANLDLLISVDTAAAHLAGAIAKPVWTLLPHVPDWRWQLNRSDTPWYPTMRLFRQPSPGDWTNVIHAVSQALAGRRRDGNA